MIKFTPKNKEILEQLESLKKNGDPVFYSGILYASKVYEDEISYLRTLLRDAKNGSWFQNMTNGPESRWELLNKIEKEIEKL